MNIKCCLSNLVYVSGFRRAYGGAYGGAYNPRELIKFGIKKNTSKQAIVRTRNPFSLELVEFGIVERIN